MPPTHPRILMGCPPGTGTTDLRRSYKLVRWTNDGDNRRMETALARPDCRPVLSAQHHLGIARTSLHWPQARTLRACRESHRDNFLCYRDGAFLLHLQACEPPCLPARSDLQPYGMCRRRYELFPTRHSSGECTSILRCLLPPDRVLDFK